MAASFQPFLNLPAGTHIVPDADYYASFTLNANTAPNPADKNQGYVVLVAQDVGGVVLDCHSTGQFKLASLSKQIVFVNITTIGYFTFAGTDIHCYNGLHMYPRAVWDADALGTRVHAPRGCDIQDSLRCGHHGCEVTNTASAFFASGAKELDLDGIYAHDFQPSNGNVWHQDIIGAVNGGLTGKIRNSWLATQCRIELDARSSQPSPRGDVDFEVDDTWMQGSSSSTFELFQDPGGTPNSLTLRRNRDYSWNPKNGVDTLNSTGATIIDNQYHALTAPPAGTANPRDLWVAQNPPDGYVNYFPFINDDPGNPGGGIVGARYHAGYYDSVP